MRSLLKPFTKDYLVTISIFVLVAISLFTLNSFSPESFPQYYVYVLLSIVIFYILSIIGFEIIKFFSLYFYVFAIVLLIVTLIIGNVTRGTVRWISFGEYGIQTSEVVRPFLILFYSKLLSDIKILKNNIPLFLIVPILPVVLISIQPSLGVASVTLIGLLCLLFYKYFSIKRMLIIMAMGIVILPGIWLSLKPYQKDRIVSFANYSSDPHGSGYNTIQSVISVGSGGFIGRGFKKGLQTQLAFLPVKHTDFIFAGISEEFGFIGAISVIIPFFILLYRIITNAFSQKDETYKLFCIGTFIFFLTEIFVNIGMNVGILPITGLPLPFVSLGGSSLLASMVSMSFVVGGKSES